MATNEESAFYDDVYKNRIIKIIGAPISVPSNMTNGLVNTPEGLRRADKGSVKSIFSDFIPSIAVYNMRGSSGDKPGVVFHTHRVIFNTINETIGESAQILKTFSPSLEGNDLHITFYGENPRMYQFSGSLLHLDSKRNVLTSRIEPTPDGTVDSNWYDSFKYAYENLMKGSKCAEMGLQVRVSYDWRWSQGYLLNFNSSFNTATMGEVPFSFAMLVVNSGTYHKSDSITAKRIVDDASKKAGNESINGGAFSVSNDGTVRFLFDS